ncbi:hypothetical protein [uncultured Thiodictyon sp.]|uniref:AMP-binding enzyme n=1 Tax=uncultured Thiodictyon sp. TaxID=1846217 RepID=UPI0025E836AC|nr:hypothetical protein [uncultured Thiodictyon sp.]
MASRRSRGCATLPSLRSSASAYPPSHCGQTIAVGVVLRPGFALGINDLRAFCARELGAFKTPSAICLLTDLPKCPSGKVQRLRLLDCFAERLG